MSSRVRGRKAEDPFKGIEGWAGFLPQATYRARNPSIFFSLRRVCSSPLKEGEKSPHQKIPAALQSP
jgi:hypothetical protein